MESKRKYRMGFARGSNRPSRVGPSDPLAAALAASAASA